MWCFHGPIRLAHVNYFTTQIKEALIRLFFQDLAPGQNPGEVCSRKGDAPNVDQVTTRILIVPHGGDKGSAHTALLPMCAPPGCGSISVPDPRNLTFSCPSHQRLFKAHVRIRGAGSCCFSFFVLAACREPKSPRKSPSRCCPVTKTHGNVGIPASSACVPCMCFVLA